MAAVFPTPSSFKNPGDAPSSDEIARLRVPPHSIEAEQSVLGGLLLDNSAWDRAADLLTDSDFYRHEHRLIYGAIAALVILHAWAARCIERFGGALPEAIDLSARGSLAAYYPEANGLIALDDYDERSGTPSYKSIPVTLRAAQG